MHSYSHLLLPYLHGVSAIIFISLSIAVRVFGGYYIAFDFDALAKNRAHLQRILHAQFICALLLSLSSFVLFHMSSDPIFSTLAQTQWALYCFAMLNQIYMYYLFLKDAKKDEITEANERLALIIYYFVPLNILISFAGIFLTLVLDSMI